VIKIKLIEKIAVKSAIRVILTLLVGFFVGIKFPEGVKIACTVAGVTGTEIELCEEQKNALQ
jgi:fucose permease